MVKANQKWQAENGTVVIVKSVRLITELDWIRMRIQSRAYYSGSTHFVRYVEEGSKLEERDSVEGFEETYTRIQ